MRRLLLASAIASAAACASPGPCTQALCPRHLDGSYRVSGWTNPVTVTSGAPEIPIVSDSSVEVLSGRVEFVNRRAVVRAAEGSSFRFEVSTASVRVPAIIVAAGSVTVALSSTAAPSPLTPGVTYYLPVGD
ncbi:MAG: hypothetical protein ACHQ2Z_13525 [Elusimicrobiota bacterium]